MCVFGGSSDEHFHEEEATRREPFIAGTLTQLFELSVIEIRGKTETEKM